MRSMKQPEEYWAWRRFQVKGEEETAAGEVYEQDKKMDIQQRGNG